MSNNNSNPQNHAITIASPTGTIQAVPFTMQTPQGKQFTILIDRDEQDDISQAIRAGEISAPPGVKLLSSFVPPGGRVLDLGGHIGTFALAAAADGYEVIAVEASPHNAALLQASVEYNDFRRVKVVNLAVSDRAETLDFIAAGPYGLVANPHYHDVTITVTANTVDAILAEMGWESVDFVKLDIEGSEVKALGGMRKLLANEKAPVIVFESNGHTLFCFDQTPQHLLATLEQTSYSCYQLIDQQLTPIASSQLQPLCCIDCLAIKQPLTGLAHWSITPPFSPEQIKSHIIGSARSPHKHDRMHIGRTLAQADRTLLQDKQIFQILHRLAHDPEEEVRNALAWWVNWRTRLQMRFYEAKTACMGYIRKI